MLLVFLILAVVTVCVTIVATYFLLNSEDYRWYSPLIPSINILLILCFLGNGQAFYQVLHQHFTFIYMLFIISSLKQSKTNRDIRQIYGSFFRMYGMFQTVFYFGYMALFSMGLGIMCGTFGYIGTQAFVRKIYSIKID